MDTERVSHMKREEYEEIIKKVESFCECYSGSVSEENAKFAAGVMYGVGFVRALLNVDQEGSEK